MLNMYEKHKVFIHNGIIKIRWFNNESSQFIEARIIS